MADKSYLAIDLGAESGRAVLGALKDDRLELEEVHRFPNGPVRLFDSLHWNALGLFDEIKTGIGKAASKLGPKALSSIGIDTWAVDYGLIGKGGGKGRTLLSNPYHYRDARTEGVMEKAFERLSKEEIFEQTGIQFLPFNTIYQLIAAKQSGDVLLNAADRLLQMGELFTFLLTGREVAEFTNATTTQLFNPKTGEWSRELFEAFDLPLELMPEVVPPGSVAGPLLKSVAEETRAGAVPVVLPAVHDTGSAVAAVPALGEDWAFISSGTWSLVGVEVQQPIITPESLRHNLTNEGGVDNTFRLLKNVMGLWILQECRREWAKEGTELDYDALTALAQEAPAFQSFIDPDDEIFFPPGDMPNRLRDYLRSKGEPLPQRRGEFVRCILESLALKYRYVLEGLKLVTGKPIRIIHVVGGGCQNDLLNQMTANASGCQVVAGPVEATSIGNVLMQAVGTGALPDVASGRALVTRSVELRTFDPTDQEEWDEAYRRFVRLVEGES